MQQLKHDSVDLIYLDPPFKSDRDYNSIYKDETGRPLPDQIQAFTDTWDYSTKTEKALKDTTIKMLTSGLTDTQIKMWEGFTKGLKAFDDEMLAYVVYMAERILEMRRVLKDTGSIYLHCDPSASHYLKIILDIIFASLKEAWSPLLGIDFEHMSSEINPQFAQIADEDDLVVWTRFESEGEEGGWVKSVNRRNQRERERERERERKRERRLRYF